MTNTYEVLLQRDNGINKTVIVNDCMYEDEARLLAESQYGLPVLRVLYKGSSSNSGSFGNNYDDNPYQNSYYRPVDFNGLGSLITLALFGVGVIVVFEFWYVFVGAGVIYGGAKLQKWF